MPTRATRQDQYGLDEEPVDDPELERALEDREKRKASKAAVTAEYKEADTAARALIDALEVDPDEIIRVGRFRITRSVVAARHVSFDTEPAKRLSIAVVDD